MSNNELDQYEIDEIVENIISEINSEINEQSSSRYNPEQMSVLNIIRRAQETPKGSSVFADLLRGAYSLPGTDDEIPPIPPEHLTIKDVYLQSIAFALRASFLAVSPTAQILTLARLMFDTPSPKTATELFTRIAGIWGNAAKDIVDDAIIRSYRAIDYSINKIIVPLLTPFVSFFASGNITAIAKNRVGKRRISVRENPSETTRITATRFNYPRATLSLKRRINNDRDFISSSNDLIDYLLEYSRLYQEGLKIWENLGVVIGGDNFIQMLIDQWNSTIGSLDSSLSVSSLEDMKNFFENLDSQQPLEEQLKKTIIDFFSGVKFDQDGGWTVIAGTAGSSSVPLPFIKNKLPIIVSGDAIVNFSPNEFFEPAAWTDIFWKFWTDENVTKAWMGSILSDKKLFFDNQDFISKYLSSGNTVFSTNSSLRSALLSQAKEYYTQNYEEEESKSKINSFEEALNGIKPTETPEGQTDAGSSGQTRAQNDPNLTDIENRFSRGELTYDDFTKPIETVVNVAWRPLVKEFRLSPYMIKMIDDFFVKNDLEESLESFSPQEIKNIIDKFIEDNIIPQIKTDSTVAAIDTGVTNLEGEKAKAFKIARMTGVVEKEDVVNKLYPSIKAYSTALMLEKAFHSDRLSPQKIVELIRQINNNNNNNSNDQTS